MGEKNKEKKQRIKKIRNIIMTIMYLLLSMGVGFLISYFGADYLKSDIEFSSEFMIVLGLLVLLSLLLQIIIHELGHMVFGLLTGYKFVSFRVFNFMIVKSNGSYKFMKYSLAGTGGQCLMSPPDYKKDYPFILYNLGGGVFNLIFAFIFFLILRVGLNNIYLELFCALMIAVGILFAVLNLIPMTTTISNDGQNIISMIKDENMRYFIWTQLKMSVMLSNGYRLKDMPKEWFEISQDNDLNNNANSVRMAVHCSWLLDNHLFDEFMEKVDYVLDENTKILPIYRELLKMDKITLLLINSDNLDEDEKKKEIDKLRNKDFLKIIKAMKKHISCKRFNYVYELLYNKDEEKAEKILKEIEKIKNRYPYKGDIDSEMELIEMAKKKYKNIREY